MNHIRVLPVLGYLNNTYGIFSDVDQDMKIIHEDREIGTLQKNSRNNHYYYFKPTKPGTHRIVGEDGSYVEFTVMDSYILGSSMYKAAYLFDDIPFVFIVKKDRCIVFDIEEKIKLDLFEFSPDSLVKYSGTKLIAKSYNNNYCNLAQLSLPSFQQKYLITDGTLIYEDAKILVAEKDNLIMIIALAEEFQNYELHIEAVKNYFFFDERYLVIELEDEILIKDIRLLDERVMLSKSISFAVNFQDGYYLVKNSDNIHIYTFSGCEFYFELPSIYSFEKHEFQYSNRFKFSEGEHREDFYYNYKNRTIKYLKTNKSIGLGGEFRLRVNNLVEKTGPIKLTVRGDDCCVTHVIRERSIPFVRGRKTKQIELINTDKVLWEFHCQEKLDEYVSVLIPSKYKELEQMVNIYVGQLLAIIYLPTEDLTKIFYQSRLLEEIKCLAKPIFYQSHNLLAFENMDGTKQFCVIDKYAVKFAPGNDFGFNYKYLDKFSKVLILSPNHVYSAVIDVMDFTIYDVVDFDILAGNYSADKAGIFKFSDTELCSSFLLNKDGLVYSIRDNEVKSSIVKNKVLASSDDTNYILTVSESDCYTLFKYHLDKTIYERIELHDEKLSFDHKESALLPGGDKLLLKRQGAGWLQLYNLVTNEYEDFFDGNFIEFSDLGHIVVEDKATNKLIYDPVSMRRIPSANYHFYKFKSPDRRLSTPLATSVKYIILPTGEVISSSEYSSILSKFKEISYMHDGKSQGRIERYANELRNKYNISENYEIKGPKDVVLAYSLIEIIDHEKNSKLEVPVVNLSYYNYAAFSFGNKYLAYVGKPGIDNGGFGVVELGDENGMLSIKNKFWFKNPKYATWVCGISKMGFFATYSSDTKTYVLDLNKCEVDLPSLEVIGHGYKTGKALDDAVRVFPDRSYLCFNGKGNLMATSQKGYTAVSRGGRGHKHSALLFIIDLSDENRAQIEFSEHAAHVVSAGFSADDTKLFSIDADGVIIVRNL